MDTSEIYSDDDFEDDFEEEDSDEEDKAASASPEIHESSSVPQQLAEEDNKEAIYSQPGPIAVHCTP